MKNNTEKCTKILLINKLKSTLTLISESMIFVNIILFILTKDKNFIFIIYLFAICAIINKYCNIFFISPKHVYEED